jgi:hypothetical protein
MASRLLCRREDNDRMRKRLSSVILNHQWQRVTCSDSEGWLEWGWWEAQISRFSPLSCLVFPQIGDWMAVLKVGEIAPEFELPGVVGDKRRTFKLADYRGSQNIVLAFYVLDWSPV